MSIQNFENKKQEEYFYLDQIQIILKLFYLTSFNVIIYIIINIYNNLYIIIIIINKL